MMDSSKIKVNDAEQREELREEVKEEDTSKRAKAPEQDDAPPTKRSKKDTTTDDDDGSSSAKPSAKKSASKQAASKGTYPKPKNFAERMMNVLENRVDDEVVKWYGDEDLIAINTKSLKDSAILDDRFQGIRYAAFIRNLSRWGFRKVPKLEVADGVVVYRNALFQRENPHLVRHMKIDSDVQDIFGQHQRSSQRDPAGPGVAHAAAPQHQVQQGAPQLPNNSLNLLSQLMGVQQQQVNTSSFESQVQNLQAVLSSRGSTVPQGQGRSPSDILQDIISLSRQYLDAVPEAAANASEESIKALLKLVVGLGSEHMRSREPEGVLPPGSHGAPAPPQAVSSNSAPLLNELLHSIGQSQGVMQQHQQQAPVPEMGDSRSALIQGIQRHQQQQQRSAMPSQLSQEADLQNILAQATGISSLSGLPLSPQLIMQLQQQQQQNRGGNPNLPSPPGNNCRQS